MRKLNLFGLVLKNEIKLIYIMTKLLIGRSLKIQTSWIKYFVHIFLS